MELTRPVTQETDVSNDNESNEDDAGVNEVVEGNRPKRIWEKLWAAQGLEVKALIGMTLVESAVDCSLVQYAAQKENHATMTEMGRDLQNIPNERLLNYKDKAYIKEVEKWYWKN